ncbi:MAG: PAS domain-containing sensor histidine kinase [Armatimonadetes bacterium]|nr:PAS domain-containing sensor histidine kinase [Armatimonadota bacterium]
MNDRPDISLDEQSDIPEALRTFVCNNAYDPMAVLRGVRIVAANKRAYELFGYDEDTDLAVLSLPELIAPDSIQPALELLARFLEGYPPSENPILDMVNKNGEKLRLEVCALPWPGDPSLVVIMLKGVSSREMGFDSSVRAEQLYGILAETMPAGIMLCDRHGKQIYVNKQASKLTGYSVQELMRGVKICHPDDAEAHTICEQALKEGVSGGSYESLFIRKDGKEIWVSLSWRAILGHDGAVRLLHTLFTDITERKQAEQALRDSEEKYKRLVENSSDMIMLTQPDGIISYLSPACAEVIGHDPEDLVGTTGGIWHPDDSDFVLAALHKALKGESGSNLEYRVVTRRGDTRWLSHSWSPVIADGKLQMVVSVVKDITEGKRAQEAIRAAEEKYRLLAENASDIIWQMDMYGIFTYVSAAVKDFGYEPSEWIGHSILDFLPEREKAATRQRMERDVQVKNHQRYEVQMLRKDGSLVWMEVSVDFAMECDRPIRIQGIARDISERKTAEEALRKAHDDITRAYDLQREFLNNITHEVRTPLTAVQGYVQMILEGTFGPVPDEQAALLKKVLASSDHLLTMVSDVLEMARLKSGADVVRPRASNPCAVINRAVLTVTPQAMRKGLSLKVNLPERDPMGMYDGEKLSAIVTNLLSNAVKFTEKGEIEVNLSCRNGGVEVIVTDTGMGISPSQLDSIFDEFQQLDYPRKHKPAGFGLGLAIVATMVEAINGTIVVSSRKGNGTAFTLFAPELEAR